MLPPDPKVRRMPESRFRADPSLLPIERPRCPKCQNRMHLTRIVPGPPGFDLRNFECAKCDQFKTVTVEADPMHSRKAGWVAGELKRPE